MTTQTLSAPLLAGDLAVSVVKAFPRKRAKWEAVLSVLPEIANHTRCLDIGTAHGGLTSFYADRGQWTYLDRDADNLAVAKTVLRGQFVQEDLLSFLSKSEAFEVVSFIDTLFYFPDPAETLKGVSRGIKPGGKLLISGVEHERQGCLAWIRSKLGISQATASISEIPYARMVSLLSESGLIVEKKVFYFGLFSQILQTAIDWAMVRSEGKGDRLTRDLKLESNDLSKKKAWLPLATGISIVAVTLDKLFSFLPRYAYMILANKPGE